MEMVTEDQLVLLFKEPTLKHGGNNSESQEPGSSMVKVRLLTHQEVTEKDLQSTCGLNITVVTKNGESNIFLEEEQLKLSEEELEEIRKMDSG
jgi:hypothetical protein